MNLKWKRNNKASNKTKMSKSIYEGSAPSASSEYCKTTAIPSCALCGTPEGSSDTEDNWIQCSNCDRWYEETCAEVAFNI